VRRFPDWLLYLAVVGALIYAARNDDDRFEAAPGPAPPADAPAETPTTSEEEVQGRPLRPRSRFDPQVMVEAPTGPQNGVGTAFAIDDAGVWFTARHVVEGCSRVGVVAGRRRVIRAEWRVHPRADLAILTTDGGPDPLPVSPDLALFEGQRAYHPGFPQGKPGEVSSRLIGRETLVVVGRGERSEPVLAWAESGRSRGLTGSLGGLSGAPALDAQGRVIGVTVAEAPRRGRIYTTAPDTFGEALEEAPPDDRQPMLAITRDNFDEVADRLRSELRVAQVICLAE
jgi:S1-C subfamily serine protease